MRTSEYNRESNPGKRGSLRLSPVESKHGEVRARLLSNSPALSFSFRAGARSPTRTGIRIKSCFSRSAAPGRLTDSTFVVGPRLEAAGSGATTTIAENCTAVSGSDFLRASIKRYSVRVCARAPFETIRVFVLCAFLCLMTLAGSQTLLVRTNCHEKHRGGETRINFAVKLVKRETSLCLPRL